ncbi:MAG: hypothetical protein FWC47_01730 [Oscillospiraceae bacterium]|nr:hypothetical protein [Oscillospiraceae bacterium]
MSKVFTPSFSKYSFAYMEGLGTVDAAKWVKFLIEYGLEYSVNIDLVDFFDNIDHEKLIM